MNFTLHHTTLNFTLHLIRLDTKDFTVHKTTLNTIGLYTKLHNTDMHLELNGTSSTTKLDTALCNTNYN